jgi:hypothetical protein
MCELSSCNNGDYLILILRVFGLLIMTILFLQSGIDKIADRKGNLEWLKGHFAQSPFKNTVPLLLTILTIQEVLTGLFCLAGIPLLFLTCGSHIPILGLTLGLSSFVSLFLGQRLAKDYAGAAGLVPYMVFTFLVLYTFL